MYKRSDKSRQPKIRKEYRKKRKVLGLCVDCPNRVEKFGAVRCFKCSNKVLQRQKEYSSSRPWVKANNHRLKVYGVTQERYVEMLFEQNGRCAMCDCFFLKTPDLDHSHETNKPRSLLCHRCNIGLAYIEDGEFMKRAKKYLRRIACQTQKQQ